MNKFVKVYPFTPNIPYTEDYKSGLIINLDHVICIQPELIMSNNELLVCYTTTISCGQFLTSIRTLTCPVEHSDRYYNHPIS